MMIWYQGRLFMMRVILIRWLIFTPPKQHRSFSPICMIFRLKNGLENNILPNSKGAIDMSTNQIYQAELRRLVRNIGLLYARAQNKSQREEDPFALYHFGQAMAFEEVIEIIKKGFEEMSEEEWE
jgi:hypothetical protein